MSHVKIIIKIVKKKKFQKKLKTLSQKFYIFNNNNLNNEFDFKIYMYFKSILFIFSKFIIIINI